MTRRWAVISLAAGGIVLVLSVLSTVLGAAPPCGGLRAGYPPIIAFELARDAADLAALFGAGPSPCRDAMVAAMDTANVIDVAVFIPAYAVFLAAWFLAQRPAAARWARAGLVVTAIAAVGDVLENVCLFALTPELDASSPWLGRLIVITAMKWIGLGGAGLCAAGVLAPRTRIGAVLCLAAPVLTVAAIIAPKSMGPLAVPGVALSWVVCLVVVGRAVLRPRSPTPSAT